MDAKLNQSDLISLLAKGSNISVAKAEQFTKNFFDLIIEGLEKDGIVKINGLGTFKIADVASRGSVNVNTGEKIEIKGHKKLTFTPADALKDIVNQPFAMFEPVEVDDTYQPETAEETENDDAVDAAEETVEVVDVETEQPLVNDDNAEVENTGREETTEPVAEETPEETDTVVEELVSPEAEEHTAEEEPAIEEEPKEENVEENNPGAPVENQEPAAPKKKSYRKFALFALIGFVVGFVAIKMMERNHAADVDDSAVARAETPVNVSETIPANEFVDNTTKAADTVAVVDNDVIAIEKNSDDSTIVADVNAAGIEQPEVAEPVAPEDEVYAFVMVEELAVRNLKDITPADTLLYVANGELARHIVAANETLTKIARHYYGDKKLWPYIVKFNNMHNPNGLGYGMELVIPRLEPRK